MNTTPSIIDISSNNGNIDFGVLFASMSPDPIDGKKRIIIRTSEGYGSKDARCLEYATKATAAGFTVSYYHFAYPDTHSGGTVAADSFNEADYFCNTIQALPPYEFLVIDLEQASTLSQTDFATWLQSFLDHVYSRTCVQCVLYTYADYLNRMLPENHTFGNCKLWIANYSVMQNPPLPKGFPDWWMWQYIETGKIDGIATIVDCSKFNTANIPA